MCCAVKNVTLAWKGFELIFGGAGGHVFAFFPYPETALKRYKIEPLAQSGFNDVFGGADAYIFTAFQFSKTMRIYKNAVKNVILAWYGFEGDFGGADGHVAGYDWLDEHCPLLPSRIVLGKCIFSSLLSAY